MNEMSETGLVLDSNCLAGEADHLLGRRGSYLWFTPKSELKYILERKIINFNNYRQNTYYYNPFLFLYFLFSSMAMTLLWLPPSTYSTEVS